MDDVGGLSELKKWLTQRSTSFSDKARKYGLPAPKGLLLLGVQGCGKSLAAKSIAAEWSLPLLRLDVGKIFNSFIGDTFNGQLRLINPQLWQAVTATSATDVWVAGGSGTVTHTIDGTTFTRTSVGPPELLFGVAASSTIDVVAVGFQGGIFRWNGAAWATESSGTTLPLLDVHAVSAGVQFISGVNGIVLNYAGSGSWTAETSGTTASLNAVHGVSGSVAWAVGDAGTICYRNGSSSWGSAPGTPPVIAADYQGVFALGSSPLYLCGETGTFVTWDGTTWTDRTSATGVTTDLKDVWAANSTNVWLVGDGGVILHFDGANVVAQASGTTEDLQSVFGTGTSDVYAVGGVDTILHLGASGTWTTLTPGSSVTYAGVQVAANTIDSILEPPATKLVAVSGPKAVAVDPAGDVLFSNSGTHQVMRLDQTTRALTVLAGTGRAGFAGDTGMAGSGTAVTAADLLAMYGASDTDVWAVGTGGTILHGNGSAWTTVASGVTVELEDVHGSGANDVWAVGGAGTILHWNGTKWSRRPSGTTRDLKGVFAVSATFAIAVGDAGTILVFSSGQWTDMLAGAGVRPITDFADVWASSTSDAWAVGAGTLQAGQGPLWRYQSGAWAPDTLPGGASPAVGLIGLFGTSATNIWAVGEASTIYRFSGSWAAEASAFTFPADVQTVFGRSGTDVFAGGAFGTFQASTGGACRVHDIDLAGDRQLRLHPAIDLGVKVPGGAGDEHEKKHPAEHQPGPGVQPGHRLAKSILHSAGLRRLSRRGRRGALSEPTDPPRHAWQCAQKIPTRSRRRRSRNLIGSRRVRHRHGRRAAQPPAQWMPAKPARSHRISQRSLGKRSPAAAPTRCVALS